ncbi:MAG: thiamine-phosphate kinase [Bosea sp. (in: a-proteobacteria)]
MAGSPDDTLIARDFAPMAGEGGLGLADDAALFAVQPGEELVITKDMLVAGVHFFADDPPASIAAKALGVNLSDLAAKAATPRGFLLGLGLPRDLEGDTFTGDTHEAWLSAFSDGLAAAARASGCVLLGGDTVSSPEHLVVSITAFGTVPTGQMLRRGGAKPGDVLLVSGTIGDAALGLQLRLNPNAPWARALGQDHRAFLLDRYLHPQPRNALTPLLSANDKLHAHAGMDVSDGLVGDLAKMLRVSGVSGCISAEDIPLSEAARAAIDLDPRLLITALTGGDDYEVLLSAGPADANALIAGAARLGQRLTAIGLATQGADELSVTLGGEPMQFATMAYSHV